MPERDRTAIRWAHGAQLSHGEVPGKGRIFPEEDATRGNAATLEAQHHTILLDARGSWQLRRLEDGNPRGPGYAYPPLPEGIYVLSFPPASVNLATLIIDPDPGGGGGTEAG
mgnify:CR=1 FL=1